MPRKRRSTKSRIVKAAWNLFYKNGYEQTTVEDIINASKTSKGTFYHYFKGKEAHVFFDVPVGVSVGEMIEKAGGIDGKYGEIIMGGAFTGKSTTLDAPTTKTTGAILVTIEFPDLHGATMGILVCACGGSEERMREIASKMNAKVVSMCKCKQAIENKPGAPLKCLRPGNCPGQVKNNIQFKKDKCEYILIGNCSDCSNTVMASGPKMGLKVFHQTDHVMRTVGHPLYRSLKVSKEVSQEIDF